MLQPDEKTKILLAKTRAKAKMYEYDVPEEHHFDIGETSLTDLLDLTIAMLGDITASVDTGHMHEEKYKLFFSAQYFDSLIQSRAASEELGYLNLLAAATYYLAGYPGSSKVILQNIDGQAQASFGVFEKLLLAILEQKSFSAVSPEEHVFFEELNGLVISWNTFLKNGTEYEQINIVTKELRLKIYSDGSDREVLMIDVIRSVIFKRINASSWILLPKYSSLHLDQWRSYLERQSAIKELWPAQILLGESGVFGGVSAVVQMPTSAGKTFASELIIRSSFLANRSAVAVIVAPFRALCQEIFNDLAMSFEEDDDVAVDIVSDVLQEDLEDMATNKHQIMILTPEKLDYLLRHNKEISDKIGLVLYDEGHLFDDETRGVKYELLLASLKRQLPAQAQVILVSAVISNAQQIKDWLIGNKGLVVEAKNLNPTSRSLAFASWTTQRGQLVFTNKQDINQSLFFVPRILESQKLELRGRERIERYFPKRNVRSKRYEPSHVAGFLGCRLASEGLTTIFAGRKDSALKIAEGLVDAFERGLNLHPPITYVRSAEEAEMIIKYIGRLLGVDSIQARAARLGFLIHHGSTPHGLRLSVEHALKNLQFKSVICTSTLAQGVNLPIKYLIIETDRQGENRMKVRDFHNLMGRTGRSGKYTEGTVIFANPRIYDGRISNDDGWRWYGVRKLINNENSEACTSRLLYLFEDEPAEEDEKVQWLSIQGDIKNGINSHLLDSLAEVSEIRDMEKVVTDLVKNTLGYFQATDEQKSKLVDIFIEIATEIMTQEPVQERRKIFAKSILSLHDSQDLLTSISEKIADLNETQNIESALTILWPSLYKHTHNSLLKRLTENDALNICKDWLDGKTYPQIFEHVLSLNLLSQRKANIDQVVDLCENGFAFSASMIVGSASELLNFLGDEAIEKNKRKLNILQRMLKYGLPENLSSTIYEMGFSDRQLSIAITQKIGNPSGFTSRKDIKERIRSDEELHSYINANYPEYFRERLKQTLQ